MSDAADDDPHAGRFDTIDGDARAARLRFGLPRARGGQAHTPTVIHIITDDDDARRRGRLLVPAARQMLGAAAAMMAQGVDANGYSRSFADGSRIEVDDMAGTLVAHIFPVPIPIPVYEEEEEEKKEPEPEKKEGEYLWIGVRVCWEDAVGNPFPLDIRDLYPAGQWIGSLDTALVAPNGETVQAPRTSQFDRYGWGGGGTLWNPELPPLGYQFFYYDPTSDPVTKQGSATAPPIPPPTPQGGADPNLAGAETHFPTTPISLRVPELSVNGVVSEWPMSLVADFWAITEEEATFGDQYGEPICIGRSIAAFSALNNPDVLDIYIGRQQAVIIELELSHTILIPENKIGALAFDYDGRNWISKHVNSPFDSSPHDPHNPAQNDGAPAYPWHHVYTVDPPHFRNLPPTDSRNEMLLRVRDVEPRGSVQGGDYTLYLACRPRPEYAWDLTEGEWNDAGGVTVEVAVMTGKHPKMVRKTQRVFVPSAPLEYNSGQPYDGYTTTFPVAITINPIGRAIGDAELVNAAAVGNGGVIYED